MSSTVTEAEVVDAIQPYSMHVCRFTILFSKYSLIFVQVSARYLDLTKKKLELTRLPREAPPPNNEKWRYGTPKSFLEPLIDFWYVLSHHLIVLKSADDHIRLEQYDWRAQETSLNIRLPQYRTTITLSNSSPSDETTNSFRIHFVHKRCQNRSAIPLLVCHGWPGSFTEVSKIIDALTEPDFTALPPGAKVPLGFHVVAPSIPGFGFSDASNEEGFGLEETAQVFNALMKQLGYDQYIAHGSEW
jgi:pimeloyl-ACP methyl ester carboxylesterase